MNKEILIDGIWYQLDIDNQEALVIKCLEGKYSNEIIIPSSFFYEGLTYRVTKIGEAAFRLSDITSIVLPESLLKIESRAFECCLRLSKVHIGSIDAWCNIEFDGPYSNPFVNTWEASYGQNMMNLYIKGEILTELTIPDTIKNIKDGAFCFYKALTSVVIPEGLTTIGKHAFYGCSNLTSITISDSVNNIYEGAFHNCSSLKSITIPEGVTSIEKNTFRFCTSLTTLDISDGVKIIGEGAFEGCSNLTSVNGGKCIKQIGDYAFYECKMLTSYEISDSVEFIGKYAFYECLSLGVVIPPRLKSIGEKAFYKCWLKSILIPKSLIDIDKCAFKGSIFDCESMEICVETGNPRYDSRNNCNAIIETNSSTLIIGCATTTIPSSIKNIGNEAFSECNNLYAIDIPSGVTHIEKNAFRGSNNLCSVTIPESIVSIGEDAFYGCVKLHDISISNLESWCNINFGVNGNPFSLMREYNTGFLKLNGEIIEELTIPDSVTTIKNHAFEGCYLTSAVIPKTVTSIGNQSFLGCYSLKSITLSNSITYIGNHAFCDCSITSLVIPKSITTIGMRAFYRCDNISYITILGNPIIQDGAFAECRRLRDVFCYSHDIPNICNAFEDLDLGLITLHVPIDTIDKYKGSETWCKFGRIVPLK